jgi:hypothetical protein
MNEMARLITREIPIHMSCCDRKSLLLLNLNVCDVMFIKCYLFWKVRELQIAESNYDFNSTNWYPLSLIVYIKICMKDRRVGLKFLWVA